MLIIVWWALLLPVLVVTFKDDGSIILEDTLPNLLKTQLMLAQGRIITISDLYGAQITRENFNPGPSFYYHYDNNRHSGSNEVLEIFRGLDNSDHPLYDVRFNYIELAYVASKTEKLILITGDPKTGKTRALRHIEMMMGDQASPVLTLYVDLPEIFASNTADTITVDDILRGVVQEDYVDLVKNIAEVSPSKIKILLDGMDQVPEHVQEKILSTILKFNEQGVNVIMTSCTDISPALAARQMSPSTIHIPSTLTNNQFEKLMTRYWNEQLLSENPSKRRLREYSKAMRILIEETPLPRSAGVARILAEQALQPSLWKPFPTATDYIKHLDNFPEPKEIIKLSNRMHFPKMNLYGQVFKNLIPMVEVYGPQALNMIFKSKSIKIRIELATGVGFSNEKITNQGKQAFPLLKFEDGVPVDFIHEDYKRYFAAKYIMNSFAANNPLVGSFTEIIMNPEHIFVLELIDSAIKDLHADKMIKTILTAMRDPKFAGTVLDNLIQHRLDNLCSRMFRIIGPENLKNYLNEKMTLQSKNKYSFGMLSEARSVDRHYYLPRKTPWQFISGSRVEMIVNLNMEHTQSVAERSGFEIHPNMQLIHAAKQSPQRFEQFLEKNGQGPYPLEVLNTAMYESLDSLGKNSFKILEKLQALGAEPANANKNGRTLAHVAAQFHDRELLSMIHENLGVPLVDIADGNGRTILIELLEFGMPFNSYTAKGAWEAMLYLAEKADLSSNRDLIERSSRDLLEFSPKIQEIPEAYRKLLIYNPASESKTSAIREVLEKYIPLRDIDLPPEVTSTRRKLLLKNCIRTMNEKKPFIKFIYKRLKMTDFVTLSELILSHYNVLGNTLDFKVYKNTISELLKKEARLLFNKFQSKRVFELIARNTRYISELNAMRDMIVHHKHDSSLISYMHAIFSQRIRKQLPIATSSRFENFVLQTVYDLNPSIEFDSESDGRINQHIKTDDSPSLVPSACAHLW